MTDTELTTSALTRAQSALDALRIAREEPTTVTAEQRDALLSWPGWGVFAPAFETTPTPGWRAVAEQLDDLITGSELTGAHDQVDVSFYTPEPVIDVIFELLRQTGFDGGRILEPGCGSGRFMALAPTDLDIEWTGVEIDPVAARIARTLNPAADIITGPLQKWDTPTGSFDAVIGNVPFSNTSVNDGAFGGYHSSLHGYFLTRALDAVRDGGYVIAITSRFTLDAESTPLTHLTSPAAEARGELIAALRLPTGTFAAEGTDVVADILLIRKRAADEPFRGWNNQHENATRQDPGNRYAQITARLTVSEQALPGTNSHPAVVNAYWAAHPDHVAGAMRVTSFYKNPLVVLTGDPVLEIQLAARAVAARLIPQIPRPTLDFTAEVADVPLYDVEGRKEGSFHVINGNLHEVAGGTLVEIRNNSELKALVALRNLALDLIRLESDPDLPDSRVTLTRTNTLHAYQAYVNKFGPLNRGTLTEGKPDPDTGAPTMTWRRPAMGGFRRDPDYVSVMALEQFNQDDGDAAPAPILLRRVNHRPTPATSAGSPAEALSIVLGEGHGVKLDRVADLLGLPSTEAAIAALGDLLYMVDGRPVAAGEYLSGNVRAKLYYAQAKALDDPTWERNVTALQQVVPKELGPLDIRVALGAPFVTAADVTAFADEVLGANSTIAYTRDVALWEVSGGTKGKWASQEAKLAYGTGRVGPLENLEATLNGRGITVYDEHYSNGNTVRVRNTTETIAAAEKARALDDRFSLWIWEDEARATRVAAEYNRRFNSHVARSFDGSHLTFDGLSDTVTPWAHQLNGVARIVGTERTLIGHSVGGGKTLTAILSVMTLRKFGLARKPLITVPNHLLEQIVREAQQAFPVGKFLIASKEDLAGDRRRLFAARCATGDWDAVVMTHGAFTSLPVSPEVEERWVEEQKSELRSASRGTGYGSSKGAKAIARAVRGLEARIGALRSDQRRDTDQVLFDHLGIDHITLDEAHLYRRLDTGSSSRDSGFSQGSSKRATDLLLKVDVLARRFPNKPIITMLTGTAFVNSLSEAWTWQRYLQPDVLDGAGVKLFDPWVAAFVRAETAVEVAPDGSGFRMQRRPVGIKNVPEMLTMLGQVADILSADQLGLERPVVDFHTLVAQPTRQQADYVHDLADRAEALRRGKQARPDGQGDDSMLLVVGDGRKVALDPTLVGIPEASTKLALVANEVARIHHANTARRFGESTTSGGLQLLTQDLGTPHPGDAQTYGRLRTLLIQRGIPADRIRFVHEAKTDKARAAMFAQAREGGISVLLGSTSKVGMGTNIQTRLVALHHVDAPWTAADVEQREGRILRPGNLNTHVDIYRYVTEGSFDSYVWQGIHRKAASFAKLYAFDSTDRELEDISPVLLSYGEVKALAAGNPLLLDHAKATSDVGRLRLMRSVHLQGVNRARNTADDCDAKIRARCDEIDALENGLAILEQNPDGQPSELVNAARDLKAGSKEGQTLCYWRGLMIRRPYREFRNEMTMEIRVGYSHLLATATIGKKMLRDSEVDLAATLQEIVERNLADFQTRIDRNRHQIDALETEKAEALTAANTAVFAQEAELDEAIAYLARIDTLINEEAVKVDLPAAA